MQPAILVPTDFSGNSINALHYAIEIAKKTHSSIILFHVFHFAPAGINLLPGQYLQDRLEEKKVELTQRLRNLIEESCTNYFHAPGDPVLFDVAVAEGGITEEIEKFVAGRDDIHLVVVGTKGASGLADVLLGGTTIELIEQLSLPLLTVPTHIQFGGITHMVYGTNFDHADVEVIEALKDFCAKFDARLSCLHVSTDHGELASEKEMMQDLAQTFWFAPKDIIQFDITEHRSVTEGISEYLIDHPAQVLALLPQTRGFFENLFHRSVTNQMAQQVQLPLLVMRR